SNQDSWNFTTEDEPDVTAPTISSFNPGDGGSNVPIGSNLQILFNESVQIIPDGAIEIREHGSSTLLELFELPDAGITISGNVLTINPTSDLPYNTELYVTVVPTSIEDLAGNDFAGFTDQNTWNFTTEIETDVTAPTVSSFSPADEANDIAVDANLIATFDEPIQMGLGGNIDIKLGITTLESIPVSDGRISIVGNQLTIDPTADLPFSSAVHVNISGAAIEDLSGNNYAGIGDNSTWNFTTEVEPDVTPPSIVTLSPADDEVDVSIQSNLVMTFDEPVFQGLGSGNSIVIREADATLVEHFQVTDGRVTGLGTSTLTFNPNTDFDSETSYYVTIPNQMVEDAAGNGISGWTDDQTWSFSTADVDPPTITNFNPSNGGTNVANDQPIILTFNEDIQLTGVGSINIRRVSNNGTLHSIDPNSAQVVIAGNVVTITPENGFLSSEEEVEVYVNWSSTPFEDLAGNDFNDLFSATDYTFTVNNVTPDTDPPAIVSLVPDDDATGVAVGANLQITFDEPVFQGLGSGNSIVIREADATLVEHFQVTDGRVTGLGTSTLTFNPNADFDSETSYYVTVPNQMVEDAAGNGISGWSDDQTWSFSTADAAPPTITNFNPSNGATNVANDQPIILTFNENIQLTGVGSINIKRASNNGTLHSIDPNSAQVVIAGNVVTITPENGFLSTEEEVEVYVNWSSTPFEDLAGNDFNDLFSATDYTFTVNNIPPDTEPPTIVSLVPANDATGVAIDANLQITYDEPIFFGGGPTSIQLRKTGGAFVQDFFNNNNDFVDISGNILTLIPFQDLDHDQEYYLTFGQGFVEDAAGNESEAISDNTFWNFTTELPEDTSPPVVVSLNPLDDATGVALDADLVITFDEPIQGVFTGSGFVRVKKVSTDAQILGGRPAHETDQFTIDGNTMTIHLAEFTNAAPEYETEYYVSIPGNSIEDMSGNLFAGFEDNMTWSFTTEAEADVTAPTVTSLNPASQSVDVSAETDLILTFNEDVQLTGSGLFRMYDRSDDQLIGTIWSFDSGATVDGNEVTYDIPIDLPYGTEIYVEIENAIEDLAGNDAADILGNSSWYFTVEGELVPPVLVSRSPANGAEDVPADSDLILTYDEEVQLTGAGSFRIFNKANDEQIGVNWSFSGGATVDGTTVTYDIPIDLPYETEVYFVITNAVEDVWGNTAEGITGNEGWVITTEIEPDVTSPAIVSFSPADNSENVAIDTDLIMTFDEVVQGTSDGSLTVRNKETGEIIGFSWFFPAFSTFSGTQITFDLPSDLPYETEFYITTNNGIEDLFGNRFNLNDTDAWTFTTVDNDDPTDITLSSQSIDENLEVNSIVGQFAAVDPNDSDDHTIEFVSGMGDDDNSSFLLNNFQLRTNEVFDFETKNSYSLRVRVTDNYDNSFEKSFIISINDVFEKVDQSITFESLEDKMFGDPDFDLTATASSGLEVAYSVVSGPISISGSSV
ncbi:MAG: Ig-like domain-containing protein, partial [Bacteroidota bacterium]